MSKALSVVAAAFGLPLEAAGGVGMAGVIGVGPSGGKPRGVGGNLNISS